MIKSYLPSLNYSATRNEVALRWVLSHSDIRGNKTPDELARQGRAKRTLDRNLDLRYLKISK